MKLLYYFLAAMVLFSVIALVCIGFMFAPVNEYLKDKLTQEVTIYRWGILGGGDAIATSWKIYPNYIIGLGISAAFSLTGVVMSVYMIEKLRSKENGDL